jgi:hypothetical protein
MYLVLEYRVGLHSEGSAASVVRDGLERKRQIARGLESLVARLLQTSSDDPVQPARK